MQTSTEKIERTESIATRESLKLNVCCGANKIPGYVNIDINEDLDPDQVADVRLGLPYQSESIDEIVFFHAIEHIESQYHEFILSEFWKLLKYSGALYISYPEFKRVAKNYIENYRGMKDFWKNTIYGLQRYPGDYHVSLMDTVDFCEILKLTGFIDIEYCAEPNEDYNTVICCKKGPIVRSYESLLNTEVLL